MLHREGRAPLAGSFVVWEVIRIDLFSGCAAPWMGWVWLTFGALIVGTSWSCVGLYELR